MVLSLTVLCVLALVPAVGTADGATSQDPIRGESHGRSLPEDPSNASDSNRSGRTPLVLSGSRDWHVVEAASTLDNGSATVGDGFRATINGCGYVAVATNLTDPSGTVSFDYSVSTDDPDSVFTVTEGVAERPWTGDDDTLSSSVVYDGSGFDGTRRYETNLTVETDAPTMFVVTITSLDKCQGGSESGLFGLSVDDASVTGDDGAVDVDGNGRSSTDGTGRFAETPGHEDVDGDGQVGTGDVQALLDDLFDDGDARAQPELFDFDGSGTVGTGDVQALLARLFA